MKTVMAPLWRRVAAFVIDMVIISLVVASQFEQFFPSSSSRFSRKLGAAAEMAAAAIMLLAMAYFVALERLIGQTVGKIITGIKVVSGKGSLSLWQCAVRSMLFIPLFPFMLLWLVDPAFMLFRSDRKRLSEVLSNTAVVQE